MAKTYREMIYIVLDELKIYSDDSVWEPEHIIFLLNKYRALLFKQRYSDKKREIPFAYYQRLNISIDLSYYGDYISKSIKKLPNLIDMTNVWMYTFAHSNGMKSFNLNMVNPQRFKFSGNNKWLKREAYVTIDLDGYMYVKYPLIQGGQQIISEGDNLIIDESGGYRVITETTAHDLLYYDCVLDNPLDVIDFNESDIEYFDCEFPIEEALVSPIVELCVKELSGVIYAPRDQSNNATDDLTQSQQVKQNN